jgi:hypothetical protein
MTHSSKCVKVDCVQISDELRALAEGQDGLLTREQVLRAGFTDATIRNALMGNCRWQRVVRGVYATFTGPLQTRHRIRAALLHAGPRAVISGGPACRAYGLRYVPDDAEAVVLIPKHARRIRTRFAQIRRVPEMPEVRIVGGIPTASPERAVLDVCRGMTSLRDIRALTAEAVQKGLTSPERLLAVLRSARWTGSKLVRRALGDLVAGCRSAPECELRDLVLQSSILPEPLWNQPLPALDGIGGTPLGTPVRPPIRPDACWPEARVVVEIDSAEWHRFGDRVEETERRRARYAAWGWTVVPVSPRRLRDEPRAVLREI